MIKIVAGSSRSLVLRDDGSVFSWGFNDRGNLGDGTTNDSNSPVQVVGVDGEGYLSDIIDIGGYNHNVALKSDGTVWAWGNNFYGQLGNGVSDGFDEIFHSTPTQVAPATLINITGIYYVGGASFATNGTTIWGWGKNTEGTLGDNTILSKNSPVVITAINPATIVKWVCGYGHILLLDSNGDVYSWGLNSNGQLGLGNTTVAKVPTKTLDHSSYTIIDIATSSDSSYALQSDGIILSCGINDYGQLGNGVTGDSRTSWDVIPDIADVTALLTGQGRFSACKVGSDYYVWGKNNYGALGLGYTTGSAWDDPDNGILSPVLNVNTAALNPDYIIFGSGYQLLLTIGGGIYACGENDYGQLGDGTNISNSSYQLSIEDEPTKATNPSPGSSCRNIRVDKDLDWTPGSGTTSYDVYFGTLYPSSFIGNQADDLYDPGILTYDTTYYWRIDGVNTSGTTRGDDWSFTTSRYTSPIKTLEIIESCMQNTSYEIPLANRDPNTIEYNWEISIIGLYPQPSDYPVTKITTEPSITVYQPPETYYKISVQQIGAYNENWESVNVSSPHLNSYNIARVLSNLDAAYPTVTETDTGGTVVGPNDPEIETSNGYEVIGPTNPNITFIDSGVNVIGPVYQE